MTTPNIPEQSRDGLLARVEPDRGNWNGHGKYSHCLSFDRGSLTVYVGGYAKNGDGYFCFKDDDLDYEKEEGVEIRIANVDNSDLLFLRNQLNKIFPPALSRPSLEPSDAMIERVARTMCWADLDGRDCASVCLAASECRESRAGGPYERMAKAVIAALQHGED